jgi:hypothetical protein
MGHERRHPLVPELRNPAHLAAVSGSVAEQDQAVDPGADEHQVGVGQLLEVDVGDRAYGDGGPGHLGGTADQLGGPLGVAGAALVDDHDLHRAGFSVWHAYGFGLPHA